MSLIRRSEPLDKRPILSFIPARWREIGWMLATALIVLVVAWRALGSGSLPFDVPVGGSIEASQSRYLIEAAREDGAHGRITRAGLPFSAHHGDLPGAGGVTLALVRLFGVTGATLGSVLNLSLLAGFVLCALLAVTIYRRLGLTANQAALAGLAFALLPLHFQHAGLLPNTLYFAAALSGWLSLEVVARNADARAGTHAWRGPVVIAALLCGWSGSTYAFFSCLVIAAAALGSAAAIGAWRPVQRGALIIAIIGAGALISFAPAWWSSSSYVIDTEVIAQSAEHRSGDGLELAQLLRPTALNRNTTTASAATGVDTSVSPVHRTAPLGLVGAAGLLVLLLVPLLGLWRKRAAPTVRDAVAPTWAVFLFATVGGFGAAFAPWLGLHAGALALAAPFIAFFAILAAITVLGALLDRIRGTHARTVKASLIGLVAVACIADQAGLATGAWAPANAAHAARYAQDRTFFAGIESTLAPGSMILQWPQATFPADSGPPLAAGADPFAPYLHTQTLRWSFGAARGRYEERWQRLMDAFPASAQVEAAAALGFSGLLVDRLAYPDHGGAIQAQLGAAGIQPALQSEDGMQVYYTLPNSKAQRYRALAIAPLDGWSVVESANGEVWIWSTGDASLVLHNANTIERPCYLELSIESYRVARTVSMWEGGRQLAEQRLDAGVPTRLSAYLDAAAGPRTIDLRTDEAPNIPEADSRALAFRIVMTKIPVCR